MASALGPRSDVASGPWSRPPPTSQESAVAQPSSLLQHIQQPSDTRPHLRRFAIAALAIAVLVLVCGLTATRTWPKLFVFDLAYLLHDMVYLPLKSWLWTSFFPWSLLLWVPIFAGATFAVWAWVVGVDPTRRWQRDAILALLLQRPPRFDADRNWGVSLLVELARWCRRLGLGTRYMVAVVENEAQASLDRIENALLAAEKPGHNLVNRTFALVDASIGLSQILAPNDEASRLAVLYDLALLSHLGEPTQSAALRRMSRLVAPPAVGFVSHKDDDLTGRGLRLLRARAQAAAFVEHVEAVGGVVETFERLAIDTTSDYLARTAYARAPESMAHGLYVAVSGHLFAASSKSWAAADLAVLQAADRLWQALTLSGRHQDHADVLARQQRRARLATCRYLHQLRWQGPMVDPVADLWPDRSQLLWSLDGAAMAAGRD